MKILNLTDIKELFKLAMPIIIGNYCLLVLGATDCLIAGRYSTNCLAAISIANAINSIVMMFGIGLMIGISPILSNYRGEKKNAKKYFYPTLKFSLIIGTIMMLVTLGYIPLLKLLNYEPHLLHDIQVYTFIVAFSSISGVLGVALKEFLQSYEIVIFPNTVMGAAVFLNLILNYYFVFGAPHLGVVGLALATTLVRILVSIILLGFCFWNFNFRNYSNTNYYKQIIKVGLPISTAIIIEFIAFNYIAIILGKVSGLYAAAHNIILVFVNASFMLPLGLSNALAVKIGYANGEKNYDDLIKYTVNGILLTVIIMSISAIIYKMYLKYLVGIFSQDINITITILPVITLVACLQLTDGLQVTMSGIFKGLKKTKYVMLSNLVAYIILGTSLGFYLGIVKELYLYGCWIAIIISSITLAGILGTSLYITLQKRKKEFVNITNQKKDALLM